MPQHEIIKEESPEDAEQPPQGIQRPSPLHSEHTFVLNPNTVAGVSTTLPSGNFDVNINAPSIQPHFLSHLHSRLHAGLKRRNSLPIANVGGTVKEEKEEAGDEEKEHKLQIRHVQSLYDDGKFKPNIDLKFSQFKGLRARRHSGDNLAQLENVQEVKNEEEKIITTLHAERKWKILKDCDEFNFKEKLRKAQEHTQKPVTLHLDSDVIPEEETKEENHTHQHHLHNPLISNQGAKLKVDEIDFERKKSEFEQYKLENEDGAGEIIEVSEVIKEDVAEDNPIHEAGELLEKAKQKMEDEKEFLKKFIRSESNSEMDKIKENHSRESLGKNENTIAEEENAEAEP